MSRRDRLAALYGLGLSARAAQSTAASIAMAVPGAGLPVAAAIELAPMAVNEIIHPFRSFKSLKHDIFRLFGHPSYDNAANAQEARLRKNDYQWWRLIASLYLPAVRAARSAEIAKEWNRVVQSIGPAPSGWAGLNAMEKRVEGALGQLEKMLAARGVIRPGWLTKAKAIRWKSFNAVQNMFRRNQGGHDVGWKVLEKSMRNAVTGLSALGAQMRASIRTPHEPVATATHAASATHAAPVARTASAAEIAARAARTAALRKQAIAAIAAAKALSARVAAGDAAAKPAYATAYRRAQDLIIQTRTAQSVPLATAPAKAKKSTAAWVGWLAAGAGVLDLARRAL